MAALEGVEFAGSLGVVTRSGASAHAREVVHSRGVAEHISSASLDGEVVTAVVFAEVQTSVPVALTVLITVAFSRSVVAVFATRDADGGRNTRSDGAVAVGVALLHVGDGLASSIADTLVGSPLAILEVIASFGGISTVGAASLAASSIVAESTHRLGAALSDGEGVIDVDVDVGAGGGTGLDVGIPHAARISKASVLSGVHDRAVADAAEGRSVPSAERGADTIGGVVDGEAADTADGGLGIPFAFTIGIALIRSGAEFALELADTSDTVGNAIITFITVTSVRTLSVADLLDRVPDAGGRFRAHGVFGDGRALGAADLIGHAPLAAVVTLDVA